MKIYAAVTTIIMFAMIALFFMAGRDLRSARKTNIGQQVELANRMHAITELEKKLDQVEEINRLLEETTIPRPCTHYMDCSDAEECIGGHCQYEFQEEDL